MAADRKPTLKELEAALLVMDCTVYCLAATHDISPLWKSQILAARDAYEEVTGDESLIRRVYEAQRRDPQLIRKGSG